ncbi:hypothetical protein [Methylobacterium sp. J-070]|uniref:hypothetical protein n=1 Tax=Methylobacterium sp. J-070 TaxID=2836650 RepID=UPI001FBA4B21|nr:hypothetical protein [Methylobacterium sp. J-070]MCJ2052100.1 hypothetical protein [Methylobacterium sp. J-070]
MNQAPMDEDCDFEHSRLSGVFIRDGIVVDVEIYRAAGTQDPWQLEVVHLTGGCTAWPARFATELAAFRAFCEAIVDYGISSFTRPQLKRLH